MLPIYINCFSSPVRLLFSFIQMYRIYIDVFALCSLLMDSSKYRLPSRQKAAERSLCKIR